MMSSSGAETATCYQAFGAAMGKRLATIRAKELNLMLHDLARLRNIRVIDVDATAAALGGAANTPDGVHQSAAPQREIREEILRCLPGRPRREAAGQSRLTDCAPVMLLSTWRIFMAIRFRLSPRL